MKNVAVILSGLWVFGWIGDYRSDQYVGGYRATRCGLSVFRAG